MKTMNDTTALTVLKPEMGLSDFKTQHNQVIKFVKDQLNDGTDYGIVPGTEKQALFQPGAEKLAKLFGLTPKFELIKEVEDFDNGFFYYKYRCTLTHFGTGKFVGDAERSCNSYEKKYFTKSVAEKWATDEEKKSAISRRQNNKGYWNLILKKSPLELADGVNTYQSMAQKRALVAVVRTATGASEIFGEDASDDESTARNSVRMQKLHAVAAERGFDHSNISSTAKKRYGVTSTTELNDEQIDEIIEMLYLKYKIVGKGNKAEPIESTNPIAGTHPTMRGETEPVEGEVVDDPESTRIANEAADVLGAEKFKCYNCDKPLNDFDGPHGTFCSAECKEKYWEAKGQKSPRTDFKFSALKGK